MSGRKVRQSGSVGLNQAEGAGKAEKPDSRESLRKGEKAYQATEGQAQGGRYEKKETE